MISRRLDRPPTAKEFTIPRAAKSQSLYGSSATVLDEEPSAASKQFNRHASEQSQDSKPAKVLLSNVVWMLVGNVAYGFSQWILMVALAKLGTVEMVGNFALALAIVLPVLMFSSLSLRSIQITDALRSYRFLEYAALRLITVVLSLLLISAFGLISGYSKTLLMSLVLIGAAKAVEYISDILYGLLQQAEDMAGIAISMLLRAVLSVIALGLAVYLTRSLVWAAASLLLCSTAVLFGYDIPKAIGGRAGHFAEEVNNSIRYLRQFPTQENQIRLWRLAVTGLPMGFALMMVSLNLNIPRYFIQQHLGMAELGMFSAISTLLASGSVAINAVGQAAAPRMANAFAHCQSRKFGLLLGGLVAASFGLGGLGLLAAVLFGRSALALVYRPEYSTHQDVLVWLMAASGLYYLGSTLGYAVTAVRCFSPQLPLFVAAALATAIGCFVFIPWMGLRGAAAAIAVSAFVQCAGSALLLHRSYRRFKSRAANVDLEQALLT